MNKLLFKIKAILLGSLLRLIPGIILRKLIDGTKTTRGCCIANINDQEIETAIEWGARFFRVNYKPGNMQPISLYSDYYVQIGSPEELPGQIAHDIVACQQEIESYGGLGPRFYAVINEANEFTYEDLDAIRSIVVSLTGPEKAPLIVKGSHTAITESAGIVEYYEYFNNIQYLDKNIPHVVHYYEKFYHFRESFIDNFLRKSMLTYMIYKLARSGVSAKDIVIGESHDGTKEFGSIKHGDYVIASKEGWASIESTASKLGIKAVCYYHAPFLKYDDNKMI